MRALLALSLLLSGCSLILDFDDLEGLPCPCDEEHVCLNAANRCVRRNSVDLGKSCSQDTVNNGDDLCPTNAVCQQINDQGPRCLAECSPSTYATPESGLDVQSQCPPSQTCWQTERGGVCSEGVCTPTPNNCAPGKQCVVINGAGVCFTPCDIFQVDPPPCGGNQVCHPITDTSVTACVPAGLVERRQICTADDFCKKISDDLRPMVCDRPMISTGPRRCLPICRVGGSPGCLGTETCALARPNIDLVLGTDLGVCDGGG
jgi:hypothetical protein